MSTPRCPFCNTPGLDRLKIEVVSGQCRVVYCGQCGTIHGVLPLDPTAPEPKPAKFFVPAPPPKRTEPPPPTPKPPPAPPPPEPPKPPPRQVEKPLENRDRIGAMFHTRGMYQEMAFDAPLCPTCKIEMVEEKVPEGHKEAGQSFWKCPNFNACKQWLPIRS